MAVLASGEALSGGPFPTACRQRPHACPEFAAGASGNFAPAPGEPRQARPWAAARPNAGLCHSGERPQPRCCNTWPPKGQGLDARARAVPAGP
ncbi:hypothetical protein NY78_2355 [Desulfovibrio sp. TomC]|nr:hypothetical protein NY78_2355 [Desulfovibrio sp. TomC]